MHRQAPRRVTHNAPCLSREAAKPFNCDAPGMRLLRWPLPSWVAVESRGPLDAYELITYLKDHCSQSSLLEWCSQCSTCIAVFSVFAPRPSDNCDSMAIYAFQRCRRTDAPGRDLCPTVSDILPGSDAATCPDPRQCAWSVMAPRMLSTTKEDGAEAPLSTRRETS